MAPPEQAGEEWIFRHPKGADAASETLDALLDRKDFGTIDGVRYVGKLQRLLKKCPWFIDGHAHLGIVLFENGDFDAAAAAFERGV